MMRNVLLLGVVVGASVAAPIIYQSNPEGMQVALRSWLDADEAAPADVAPSPGMAGRATVAREARSLSGRKVSIPVAASGHFIADFKLNGRKEEALVDTGATLVAINESIARRIGVRLAPGDFKYRIATANGTTMAAPAKLDSLQIGRIYVEDVDAVVLKDSALHDILVGMSFLKRLSRYQVEDNALVLEQ